AVIASIGAAPVHARALVMALLKRKASWTVTNARSGVLPGIELVLPHVGLLLLNAVAIVVGLSAMTDVPATLLSVAWASLHIVNLTHVPGDISPAVDRLVDAHERHTPRRGPDLKKWRARVAVLLMISAAVFAGTKLVHLRDAASAHLGLGTVTLTAAGIPVES